MGLFKKKDRKKKEKKKKRKAKKKGELFEWKTNAPEGWPVIRTRPLKSDSEIEDHMNLLAIAAAISETFESNLPGFEEMTLIPNRLTPGGVLEIPLSVTVKGVWYPIFFYAKVDEDAAADFQGAREVLEGIGETPPIYYAADHMPEAPPKPPLRPWGTDLLGTLSDDDALADGHYSMWWPTPGDEVFSGSMTVADIRRAYEAMNRIESYVFAAIMRHLEYIDEKTGRAALPDEMVTLPLKGPEYRFIVMSVSQEKGIRFHFHKETTDRRYRDCFWKLFADDCEGWRNEVERRRWPKDPEKDEMPFKWWDATQKAMSKLEGEGADVFMVGTVIIGEPKE
jgi:hypothetical protein